MRYKELFQIVIEHSYFSNECTDLLLVPDKLTLQLLKKKNFIVRNTTRGLKIFIPINAGLPVKFNDLLCFNVFPVTYEIGEITDMLSTDANEILLFTNENVESDNEKLEISKIKDNTIYNGFNSIAKVKIKLNKVSLISKPLYKVSFQSKSIKWKYYVVSNAETTKIEIKDKEKRLKFMQLEGEEDQLVASLKLNFPKKKMFVFESNATIEYSNKVFKNIQLLKDEDIIIKHLGNPSKRNNGIQIIKIN